MDMNNDTVDDYSAPFINFSNHPSSNWSNEQLYAIRMFTGGTIIDIPFPQVSASADESEITMLASDYLDTICSFHPAAVMCQGEFGLTYQVVKQLKDIGIRVVYSCSERSTVEEKTETGSVKTSEFTFVRFREY